MAYRILIVDDFKMAQLLFEEIIRGSDRYECAATLSSAEEAVEWCRTHTADLIIMDVVMTSGINGLEASARIRTFAPDVRILMVSSMPEFSYLDQARQAGVNSFWYKEVQEQPLLEIMDRTMAGESVYPDHPPVVALGDAVSTDLTRRELEVLKELAGGASNKEIAETLNISDATVKMHIRHMLEKTGFRSRLELAVKARTGGLVVPD